MECTLLHKIKNCKANTEENRTVRFITMKCKLACKKPQDAHPFTVRLVLAILIEKKTAEKSQSHTHRHTDMKQKYETASELFLPILVILNYHLSLINIEKSIYII